MTYLSRYFCLIGLLLPGLSFAASDYDKVILAAHPLVYLSMENSTTGREPDLAGNGYGATYLPEGSLPVITAMPNGDPVPAFDGASQYLEIGKVDDALSIPKTGQLTIEAWIRPDTLQFPHEEETGYVHWIGKGEWGQYEYAGRMYSLTNKEDPTNNEDPLRPNRISDYAWNLEGDLGSGSYFQDPVFAGEWIYVTMIYTLVDTTGEQPPGFVILYKNGELRDTTPLKQYDVTPRAGTAPFRVATRDFASFFLGAIGKIAIYDRVLDPSEVQAHYRAMTGSR